jgi:hypothetical protein
MPPIADNIERARHNLEWRRLTIARREISRGFTASTILTSAGVGAAAGALIAFSFAMSPPFTLLPPRPGDANGNPPLHRSTKVVVASAGEFDGLWHAATKDITPMPTSTVASADDFNGRWHEAINGIPPMPASKSNDSPNLQDIPMPSMIAVQGSPTEPDKFEFVSKPQQDNPEAPVVVKPPARPSDVCARNGMYRIEYTQNRHRYWHCLHRNVRPVPESKSVRVSNQSSPGNEPQPFFQQLRGFFFQSTQ